MARERPEKRDIVAKFDALCVKCRSKVFAGSGATWDGSVITHIVCPTVTPIARACYQAAVISSTRWKELCEEAKGKLTGVSTLKVVIEEDREAYKTHGLMGMLQSVMSRTRVQGTQAVEIVREWLDTLKAPIDEEKFQKVNQSCRRELPALAGGGSPTTGVGEECVDWDKEAS